MFNNYVVRRIHKSSTICVCDLFWFFLHFALYVTFCIFLIVHLILNVLFSGFYFALFIITKILNEFFLWNKFVSYFGYLPMKDIFAVYFFSTYFWYLLNVAPPKYINVIYMMIYAKWLIKTETLALHNGCNI
jgi:hypothetical protein